MMKKLFVFSLIGILLLLVSCEQAGEKNITDYAAFLALLENNGIQYIAGDPDTDGFLSVRRRPLWIGDEIISVYEYASHDAMEADAASIDRGGASISFPGRGVKISWVSFPYFFKDGKLIVNYVGDDAAILEFLNNNFGKPFAGHGVVG
jgi:hypothetical protein